MRSLWRERMLGRLLTSGGGQHTSHDQGGRTMRKTALLLALGVSALSMARFDEASRALKGPLAKRMALVLLLGIAAALASDASPREAEAVPRPNILFILTDDQ